MSRQPEWWPGPPPRVESETVRALIADPSAERVSQVLDRAAQGGGVIVEPAPGRGGEEVYVTFVTRATDEDPECAVILDTITDTHRADLTPMRLEPVPGTDVLAGSFALPIDLRVTCAWWAGRDLDLQAGRDRDGWCHVLAHCTAPAWSDDVVGNAHGGLGSVLALPDALAQPWYAPRPGVPAGEVCTVNVFSAHLGRMVDGWIHVPAGATGPFALAVLLDGDMWTQIQPLGPTLDNLHHEGAIRPTITVFVDSGERALRFAELGLHPKFPAFVADELLTRVRALGDIQDDPRHHVVAGQSLGGLAAAQVVHARPETFASAIVQSGSFWWPDEEHPGELTERYRADPPPNGVRIFHEVGRFENQLLDVNREFRDVASSVGVEVTYREVAGGHDYASWRGGLADGLVHLLRP
ncbi:alpha/beta hydrolase-fold protein [Gephyromycinifex aptenodytis]|uniref:alpha/beta hydrolase-fold protein n=1 Tax=Gephyromycinifex aptenodytis TaxID=2716227 RepID=UPI0014487251|nr:alpha/beta hydrolase-fold protein [Gephyromycinifex aptenodytis]